jgi:hypothetical protein
VTSFQTRPDVSILLHGFRSSNNNAVTGLKFGSIYGHVGWQWNYATAAMTDHFFQLCFACFFCHVFVNGVFAVYQLIQSSQIVAFISAAKFAEIHLAYDCAVQLIHEQQFLLYG